MILLHGKPLKTRNPEMRVDTSVQIMLNTLLKKHHSEQTHFLDKWVVDVHQCMPITQKHVFYIDTSLNVAQTENGS